MSCPLGKGEVYSQKSEFSAMYEYVDDSPSRPTAVDKAQVIYNANCESVYTDVDDNMGKDGGALYQEAVPYHSVGPSTSQASTALGKTKTGNEAAASIYEDPTPQKFRVRTTLRDLWIMLTQQ